MEHTTVTVHYCTNVRVLAKQLFLNSVIDGKTPVPPLGSLWLQLLLTLNRRKDVLNVTQKRLPYAERTFKTSPKR